MDDSTRTAALVLESESILSLVAAGGGGRLAIYRDDPRGASKVVGEVSAAASREGFATMHAVAHPLLGDRPLGAVRGLLSGPSGDEAAGAFDFCSHCVDMSAEVPVFIAVENCEFADPGSIEALTLLARRCASSRVMLFITAAIEWDDPAVSGIIAGAGSVVELGSRAAPPDDSARLEALERLVLASLHAVGGTADLSTVEAVSGLARVEVEVAVGHLRAAGMLAGSVKLSVVGTWAGWAALERLDAAASVLVHRRAAEWLAARGAAADEVAALLLRTDPAGDEWVVQALRAGARSEHAQVAPRISAKYLDRALREPPGSALPAVLRELGAAESHAGLPSAVAHLRRAEEVADDHHDRREAATELADALARAGDPFAAAELLEQHIDGADPEAAQALELRLIGLAPLSRAVHRRVVARFGALHGAQPDSSPVSKALAAAIYEHEAMASGSAQAAGDHVLAALATSPLSASRDGPLNSHRPLWLLLRAERFADASQYLEDGLVKARRTGQQAGAAMLHALSAYLYVQQGGMDDAASEARSALDLAEVHGFAMARDLSAALLVEALLEQGQTSAAEQALERGSLPPGNPSVNEQMSMGAAQLLIRRGRLKLALGDHDAGLRDLLEVGDMKQRIGVTNPAGFSWLLPAVSALVDRGDRDRAIEIAEPLLAPARTWGAPGALAETMAAVGVCTGDIGLLERAASTAAGSEARAVRARVRCAQGAVLQEKGRGEAAGVLLDAARMARLSGMTALEGRARGLASAEALKSTRSLSGLTDRELVVARLVAEGMTNQQIALALSLSPRTVQVHVSNALRKTDTANRTALAAAVRDPQPSA